MKIYLGIPYSHKSRWVRWRRFRKANAIAARLFREGHHVFSPISHCHYLALKHDLPKGSKFWKEYNKCFLDWCEELHYIPLGNTWKTSRGLCAEIKYAERLGKKIIRVT